MARMRRNRRNLYRILHVQPEAPVEVIRASHEALTGIFGAGAGKVADVETLALVNEAWSVLSDPVKRAAYDRSVRLAVHRQGIYEAPAAAGATPVAARSAAPAKPVAPPQGKVSATVIASGCPFCGRPLPNKIGRDSRCGQCSSPLATVAHSERKNKDLLDRRGVSRIDNQLGVTVYVTPQSGPLPARLKDISMNGASLVASNALQAGQVIRLVTRDFDSLAKVVSARRKEEQWIIGVNLLTWLVIQ
jgi:curved DNA-binding protein CbpA